MSESRSFLPNSPIRPSSRPPVQSADSLDRDRRNHNLEASGHYPSTQDAVEDDIDRYLDDDPYYDFTEEEEEEEEGDKKEEVEAAGNAGASKSQTAQEQSEKGGASNALGLLAIIIEKSFI